MQQFFAGQHTSFKKAEIGNSFVDKRLFPFEQREVQHGEIPVKQVHKLPAAWEWRVNLQPPEQTVWAGGERRLHKVETCTLEHVGFHADPEQEFYKKDGQKDFGLVFSGKGYGGWGELCEIVLWVYGGWEGTVYRSGGDARGK